MKKTMLITRPCYDDATNYLFHYAGLVIDEAMERGIQVFDLTRPRLTMKIFTEMVNSQSPGFIFLNAHGNEKIVYGDKLEGEEEILLEEDKNHHVLNHKIVYCRSCWSGASLGKACYGGCFIGYKTPFSFWLDENWSSKPLNDKIAKNFLEPSNIIASSLIKGNSAKESMEKSLNAHKKNMLKLLSEKEEPGAMTSVITLWSNMEGLVVFGNAEMRL